MQGILLVNNWTNDVNDILDKIRINSIVLSNEHKKTYFLLASRIKWFRVPVIFLSALGSIFGIGLSPYLQQLVISEICSVMSLVVGLIGSLELFLAISTKMENELVQSKELYLLAIEIQKTLLLDVENRNGDGMAYLEDKFNIYSKLIENSYLLECKIMDELTPLPNEFQAKIVVKRSNNSKDNSTSARMQPRRSKNVQQPILNLNHIKQRRQVAPLSPHSSDEPRSPSPPSPPPPSPTSHPPWEELPRPHNPRTYSSSSIHKKTVLVDKRDSTYSKQKQKQPTNEMDAEDIHAHSTANRGRSDRVESRPKVGSFQRNMQVITEGNEEVNSIKQHDAVVSEGQSRSVQINMETIVPRFASSNAGTTRRQGSSLRKSFVKLTEEEVEKFANRQYHYMRNQALMKANLKEIPRPNSVHTYNPTMRVNHQPPIPKSKSHHDIYNMNVEDTHVLPPLTLPEMKV